MRVGFLHLSLAGLVATSALLTPAPWRWLPAWSATALAAIAAISLRADPRWLGKRADGTQAPLATAALAPFLLALWSYWHVRRPLWSEQAGHQLLPDLCIGRRLLGHELAPVERLLGARFDHIVDLTCEYREARALRQHPSYVSLPIVDGCAPSAAQLARIVQRVLALPGRKFLHCAMGHGRTAMVAGAVLLVRGVATDVDDALRRIRAVRPKARPYPQQVQRLTEFWQLWRTGAVADDGAPPAAETGTAPATPR